jgi:hypothetical protein
VLHKSIFIKRLECNGGGFCTWIGMLPGGGGGGFRFLKKPCYVLEILCVVLIVEICVRLYRVTYGCVMAELVCGSGGCGGRPMCGCFIG